MWLTQAAAKRDREDMRERRHGSRHESRHNMHAHMIDWARVCVRKTHAGLFCHRHRARGLVTINMHDPGLPPQPCPGALWSASAGTRQSTGPTTLPNPRPPPCKIVIAAHGGSHLLRERKVYLARKRRFMPPYNSNAVLAQCMGVVGHAMIGAVVRSSGAM